MFFVLRIVLLMRACVCVFLRWAVTKPRSFRDQQQHPRRRPVMYMVDCGGQM